MTETGYSTPEGTLVRAKLWFDDGFTRVPNSWVRDKHISFKGKGILQLLLSHQPGFRITIRSLASSSTDGKDAVTTGVQELERRGYLRRIRNRKGGRELGSTWVLQDPWAPAQPTIPGLSTGGGFSDINGSQLSTGGGFSAAENPVPKEEQLKKISNHLPEVRTDRARTRNGSPVWAAERCDGNWKTSVHELGAGGKCQHCQARPTAFADPQTGELL